jgi:aryl-alcohol dehydrogenase-like predicted oxidoreductase
MGESKIARVREVAALRLGIELGMSLIDTAEMYGDGGTEGITPKRSPTTPRRFCAYDALSV